MSKQITALASCAYTVHACKKQPGMWSCAVGISMLQVNLAIWTCFRLTQHSRNWAWLATVQSFFIVFWGGRVWELDWFIFSVCVVVYAGSAFCHCLFYPVWYKHAPVQLLLASTFLLILPSCGHKARILPWLVSFPFSSNYMHLLHYEALYTFYLNCAISFVRRNCFAIYTSVI